MEYPEFQVKPDYLVEWKAPIGYYSEVIPQLCNERQHLFSCYVLSKFQYLVLKNLPRKY